MTARPKPPGRLIDKAWEQYEFAMRMDGISPDRDSFIGGFFACFGVLAGTLDVGIQGGTLTQDVMAELFAELQQISANNQAAAIKGRQ